jgi:nicotinamidase-related amidase
VKKPALILIDIQKGFEDPYWGVRNNPEFEKNVSTLLHHWRKAGADIYHVQHLSTEVHSPLRPELPGVELMEIVRPLKDEPVFQKNVNSAFIGTTLEATLREHQHTHLVLVGLSTDHCVSTSARMAANLGFRVTLVSDGTATFNRKGSKGENYPAELVHEVSLASLNNEFAQVLSTQDTLKICPV